MKETVCHIIVFLWILPNILVESCTLPLEWDGEWHDSMDTEQDITITRSNSYVEGWKIVVYSDTVTSWTCVDQDTSNNLLLFKSNQTANIFGQPHSVYRCIKWGKLTDFSYTYLIHANSEPNAENKRVLVTAINELVNIRNGCDPSSGVPTSEETVVMIKKGYIENATQNCPTPFLGSFNYSLNDGSSTLCDGTSMWDVCTDRTQMVVNYTLCNIKQFYSSGGVGYCAYSTSVGSTHYVTVVNADSTVDFINTFRFTCYAVTTSGGYVLASDNKGACTQNQSPQTKSSTGTGTLTFSAYETCQNAFTSAASESAGSNIGLIAGAVVGVLVVAVVVGVILYKKYKARIKPNDHSDEEKVQPPADPVVTPRDATVIELPKEQPNKLPPLQK